MKKLAKRLKHDFLNLKKDFLILLNQIKSLFKFLFMNREDIPLKFNVFNFKTIRFSLKPITQKIIGVTIILCSIIFVSLSTQNMIQSFYSSPSKMILPSMHVETILDNSTDNQSTDKVIIDQNNEIKLKQEISDETKIVTYSSNFEERFKIINDKIKFHTVSLSPYPAAIKEAKLEVTDQREFRIKLKLTNDSNETLQGGVSAYLSYVDQDNKWHQKFSHHQAVKKGDYISGNSTKYRFNKSSTKYLNFDFTTINVKAVNTIHIYLKDKSCFEFDAQNRACSFETAKKKYSAYIEQNIKLDMEEPNYAIYKK